ncbi:MAG: class I SAM-dependent methyltransferase [Candidatus Nanopelagicales bacterium]|nr:class I SAM-dependent methyltransferase [Candidatus Nanopelagicales bacterium]
MHSDEIRRLGDLEDRHWWYAERRSIIRRAVRRLPADGWALDVGAAAGGNTRVLAAAGWRCLALESSATGAELAHERGLTVLRGDATALPVADGRLGLVVAYDVLEHIPDDRAAAAEVFRALRTGGTFLVAVPADMRLWSAHDVAVDHVRRYERDELLGLIEGAGFLVTDLRSWNVLLRPVARWRRRRSTGSDLDDPGRVVNAGLRAVVVAERVLPVGRWPGVSLLLTATKP